MTDFYADWVTVVPAKGEEQRTVRALLDIAGDPALVRSLGANEFMVPASIAEQFMTPNEPPKPRRSRAKKQEE